MKLKQVLEIQKVLGNKIPIDMNEKWVYHSQSRGEWIDLMELDVIHAIRILRKHIVDIERDEDSDEQPDVKVLWLE